MHSELRPNTMNFVFLMCLFLCVNCNHIHEDEPCNRSLVVALSGFEQLVLYDPESSKSYGFTPTTHLENAVAVAADHQGGFVFFTDVSLKQIFKKDFKSPANTTSIYVLDAESEAHGIAVDSTDQKVYYTDYGQKLIARMDYNGMSHQVLLTEVNGLEKPHAIVLDTDTRKMYYTDWGNESHISKANLDGSNIEVLQDTDLGVPTGLSADFKGGKLYWCDALLDKVFVMNINGTNRQLLFSAQQSSDAIHFCDIVLAHDNLYISTWDSKAILKIPTNGGHNLTTVATSPGYRINGIAEVCITVTEINQLTAIPNLFGTTQPPRDEESITKEEGLSMTLIIVIAMSIGGGLVALLIIALTVCYCVKHCHKGAPNQQLPQQLSAQRAGSNNSHLPPPYHASGCLGSSDSKPDHLDGNTNMALDNGEYLNPVLRETSTRLNTGSGVYASIVDQPT